MFDLTLNEEDKNSYIVDVRINDNGTYTVKYASGREENFLFSIHNFQVELHKMEKQFKEYGKDYLERVCPNFGIRTSLLVLLFVIDIKWFKMIIDEGITFSGGWCLLYCLYVLSKNTLSLCKQRKLYVEAKKKIELMKLYLDNKEQFIVDVVNPNTGKEEEWYLVDLANIDRFEDENEFNDYVRDLTPEKKLEEAKELTLKFKNFTKGVNVEC